MATINPSQDYDVIYTLELKSGTSEVKIRLYRGSSTVYSGTVYYRTGTSGSWTSKNVSGDATTITVTGGATTMQVGHSWNKSGNNYMTPSFDGEFNLLSLNITQKAILSGKIGGHFFGRLVDSCASLTFLDIPDVSSVTSIGNLFFDYAVAMCHSLNSVPIPDTSNISSVDVNFMRGYLYSSKALTRLELPDEVGWFSEHNVNWAAHRDVEGLLKGYTKTAQAKTDWEALTVSGKTLYTNYIRSANNVIYEPPYTEPAISNVAASNITATTARLNYNLTDDGGDDTTVKVYWGTTNGETTPGSWQNNQSLGVKLVGSGYYDVSSLTPGTTYYFRYYAENSVDGVWASSTASFNTSAIKTVSIDMLIQATDTETVSMDMLIRATDIKTVSADMIIKDTVLKTVDLSTLIRDTNSISVALGVLLQSMGIETISADMLLKATGSNSVALDIIIDELLSKTIDIDLLLKATDNITTVIDMYIRDTGYTTANISVLLRGLDIIKTTALDMLISGSDFKTTLMDILLSGQSSIQSTVDMLLQGSNLATTLLDILINKESYQSIDISLLIGDRSDFRPTATNSSAAKHTATNSSAAKHTAEVSNE